MTDEVRNVILSSNVIFKPEPETEKFVNLSLPKIVEREHVCAQSDRVCMKDDRVCMKDDRVCMKDDRVRMKVQRVNLKVNLLELARM